VPEYPAFTISTTIKDRLRRLELELQTLQQAGITREQALRQHAKDQAIEVIFHSNKIEGSPLTRGETESALAHSSVDNLSVDELEAKNLETAYLWMLENYPSCSHQPEAGSLAAGPSE
jgi:hypothetical protein